MPVQTMATAIAAIWSGAFFVATIMGFIANPIVGDGAFFQTNFAHNLVHFGTAIAFGVVAILGARFSVSFMLLFGIMYLGVGLIGFAVLGNDGQGHLLGIVHINMLDNYLHLVLGAGIFACGLGLHRRARQPVESFARSV